MGRLDSLKGKIEDWGTKDYRRLASLRLDKEFRDSETPPTQLSLEPPDWLSYAYAHEKVHRNESKNRILDSEEIVRLRRSLYSKKRNLQGEY